ncbi:hypothetical protein CPB83DRAFT_894909 [Crepidotus variabilis]|uniref:Uncharacterized protein n=1 Tax=Crepidotus variabilis TaxID=179855 RepID=A0A9P6EFC6_9AGAR|nr:hypothetical protein CPB83DRAFT_894909 [Crepidotus variabilis]
MSFQHFRLGEITPVNHIHQQAPTQTIPTNTTHISSTKQPYGSGDSEDGYTLIFATMEEFLDWRNAEEERNCVEFVKGDTHGSKADPPRFKDHTKLVCARHSRSGRKKYVKKHPERVRKVPSRKLEGIGCSASISYKTYFDSDQVRACYISQHSHSIGPENLPYTRKGRKAAAAADKDRGRSRTATSMQSVEPPQMTVDPAPDPSVSHPQQPPIHAPGQTVPFTAAVAMLAPLPGQPNTQPPNYEFPPGAGYGTEVPNQERWDNMGTLFQAVRDHARTTHYPPASVAALETVLIRLYLESPIGNAPLHMAIRPPPLNGNAVPGPSHSSTEGTS